MKTKLDFVLREIAGDLLLVPCGKSALDLDGMLTLNEVGAEIWKMLPEVDSQEEIVSRLSAVYDAETDVIAKDVSEFLEGLTKLGIL